MQLQVLLNQFLKIIKNNKLSHLYLITGSSLEQRKNFVLELSYQIFQSRADHQSHVFNKQTLLKLSYPNFYYLNKDNHSLKKEQIVQFQKIFNQTSLFGKQRIYVIEAIDKISSSAAHSLLHFLENTPPNITGFLLTDNLEKVLSTIVSRCQIISINHFGQSHIKLSVVNHQEDLFDVLLLALLNQNYSKPNVLSTSDYYCDFKYFLLFFLKKWQQPTSLVLSCASFSFPSSLNQDFNCFLNDFWLVLLRWFLDLLYKKIQLSVYFIKQPVKKIFQNLTLQDNIKILTIIQKYYQKNVLVNPQNLFFAFLMEIDEKRNI
ncbi:DNA polymerase III subunit delta' ['Fragaria x ananassa' phyllody phytoplasma]|uniref:DNA polymerase III subunit delta n=1 Tax='Fragaria x ananassa' phyllody phytoplasma TaxID=2358428 RepID=A0ABS5K361_9MOLU|nr:DNA polymerase III subunit delta' ['Fragaria x ananassa' phyllody phytoplasma]MBS2126331.1 DNA polymerase III subunit delta' ['Fragaria x ananassa' phyllody phytoplasma]